MQLDVNCLFCVVERHRKEKINAGINRIGNLLPCSQALKQVWDKLSLLFDCMVSIMCLVCTAQAIYNCVT